MATARRALIVSLYPPCRARPFTAGPRQSPGAALPAPWPQATAGRTATRRGKRQCAICCGGAQDMRGPDPFKGNVRVLARGRLLRMHHVFPFCEWHLSARGDSVFVVAAVWHLHAILFFVSPAF